MSGGERKVGKRILEIWNFDHKCTWGPESEVIPIPWRPVANECVKTWFANGSIARFPIKPDFRLSLDKNMFRYECDSILSMIFDGHRNIEREKKRKKKKNVYLYPDLCKHETRLPLIRIPGTGEYNRIFYQPLPPSKRRNIIVFSETSCFENYVISWTAWKKEGEKGKKKKKKSKNMSGNPGRTLNSGNQQRRVSGETRWKE